MEYTNTPQLTKWLKDGIGWSDAAAEQLTFILDDAQYDSEKQLLAKNHVKESELSDRAAFRCLTLVKAPKLESKSTDDVALAAYQRQLMDRAAQQRERDVQLSSEIALVKKSLVNIQAGQSDCAGDLVRISESIESKTTELDGKIQELNGLHGDSTLAIQTAIDHQAGRIIQVNAALADNQLKLHGTVIKLDESIRQQSDQIAKSTIYAVDSTREVKSAIHQYTSTVLSAIDSEKRYVENAVGVVATSLNALRSDLTDTKTNLALLSNITSQRHVELVDLFRKSNWMRIGLTGLLILAMILMSAVRGYSQQTNVNPAIVVSDCGNGPVMVVNQRIFLTVDTRGRLCVGNISLSSSRLDTLIDSIQPLGKSPGISILGTFGIPIGSIGDRLKVDVPVQGNPCINNILQDAAISQTATTRYVTGVPGLKTVICAVRLVAAAAEITSEWEGTGTNCGTGTIAHSGSTTAANGESFAANGGYQSPALPYALLIGNDWCVAQSSTSRVSGKVWFTRVP